MINGLSLQDLAKEIERVEMNHKDYLAPTDKLTMTTLYNAEEPEKTSEHRVGLVLENGERQVLDIGPVAHEQIADRLKIPRQYYRRMAETEPDLLSQNVNTWLHKNPETRLVRTLDNNVRAFLSDRFRPLDNYMIASAALPVLRDTPGIHIKSTALTERRLYIQAVTEKITAEVRAGDVIQAGIVISNSEIGCGSVRVEPLLYRLICLNGMVTSYSLRKYHVGKKLDSNDSEIYEHFATDTIEKDNESFMLKVRDIVKAAFNEVRFNKEVVKLRAATEDKIAPEAVNDTIVEITKRFSMNDGEGSRLLGNLISDGDLTKYGLANAVTAIANDMEDYDRGVELERIGGQIIDLKPSEWVSLGGLN